ncbi:biotin--[acetyl-CoA-carboxylase] ligase [Leptolyngbya sp. FACHB-36]|uniref:biotin--[acetyl-CoA-carboxylase] ligase n=1 Tax=Leptolyngbya sp. FACHB-36 TaxID=2692808 RepID=UPI001680DDEA|nr:biotin--[acetyl-CoA-carboxylase] ligase [Leptolyngbya sp. FACHB-36]MBD2021234.1 biotin--[acetyl-CoA-carboxylase] ligase [Leptolyngbya sp. FACHB-36]
MNKQLETPNLPWLHELASCSSTNTWAIAHAAELGHGDVVFTRHQTAGRGQHGRVWYAPAGVLTASFVLDRVSVAQLPGLSLAAGLAVIHAVEALAPDLQAALRLKWTNDVLIEERKLAGILCEAASSSRSSHTRVVVGVGLNRCADFSELDATIARRAISLHQVAPVPEERVLFQHLRHHLMQTIEVSAHSGLADLLPELHERDALRDRWVTLELAGTHVSGQALGVDAIGRLRLRLSDGQVRAFSSGRVVNWSRQQESPTANC